MRIKFCGMRRQDDVDAAARLGVDAVGFIFHPVSPRACPPEAAAALSSPGLARVGVFVEQKEEEIARIMALAHLDVAQLHGGQDTAACARRLGAERLWRVIWPQRYGNGAALQALLDAQAPYCAAFLLDAGTGGGGSGSALDWAALRGLRWPRPWWLAGGLGPDNVAAALALCRPDGLDINSGVEDAPGMKNREKMAAVMRAVRRATAKPSREAI